MLICRIDITLLTNGGVIFVRNKVESLEIPFQTNCNSLNEYLYTSAFCVIVIEI